MGPTCVFLRMLKERTLPFKRVTKTYILKFRHIELAIGGDIHTSVLQQVKKKDPKVGFVNL